MGIMAGLGTLALGGGALAQPYLSYRETRQARKDAESERNRLEAEEERNRLQAVMRMQRRNRPQGALKPNPGLSLGMTGTGGKTALGL